MTLAAAIQAPVSASADTGPVKIMLVGSSTTHGSAGDYTWRYRLWQHLTGNEVAVDFVGPGANLYDNINSTSGNSAESTAYADPNFDKDHDARWGMFLGSFPGYPTGGKALVGTDVETYQPDYVAVMLGLNDLAWFSTREPALVAADMQEFISNARAARPDVRLVLVAVQPTKSAQDNATLSARIADYNQRLSDLASAASTETSPVAYVPQAAGYEPNFNMTPHDSYDGTHPNARGEMRIAGGIADTLSSRWGLGPAFNLNLDGVATGPVLPFTLQCIPGNGQVTLSWTASPGATGYWSQRRVAGGAWEPQQYQYTMSDSPRVSTTLTNGTTYEYRLQAAKWYDKGVFSNVCSATPQVPAPAAAPLNLTATPGGDGSVALSWTAPPGTGLWYWIYQRDVTAGETAFTKLQYPVVNCCWANIGKDFNVHQHVYEYRLSASNAGGEGPQSTPAQAAAHYVLPFAPTALTATVNGGGSVTLTWSSPTPMYFWVYARDLTAGQTTFIRGAYPTANLTATRTGLIAGHVYEYTVSAHNQGGEGPKATPVRITA